MGAGFKSAVKRRAPGFASCFSKCDGFGMRPAPRRRCAFADDFTVLDDQAADIGIGRRASAGGLTEPRRFEHEAPVGQTYSMPNSFWSFSNSLRRASSAFFRSSDAFFWSRMISASV